MMRQGTSVQRGLLVALLLILAAAAAAVAFLFHREVWRIDVESEIAAPPAQVFALLATREGRLAWEPDLIDIAPLTGSSGSAGSTQLLYMRHDREHWQIEERWTRVLPERRLELERMGARTVAYLVVTLQAEDGGTHLRWREIRRYESAVGRLLAPLDIHRRRNRIEAGLARLAYLAEGG
ncbi:MAG: SRPBCC family protein [Alphaproteobacteria bacterium]|nr:MAG: SRPBCC family protein [Alphaproteobacteria bacterium]